MHSWNRIQWPVLITKLFSGTCKAWHKLSRLVTEAFLLPMQTS
jgi:hypothetical protein